jgi:hypothetical protein
MLGLAELLKKTEKQRESLHVSRATLAKLKFDPADLRYGITEPAQRVAKLHHGLNAAEAEIEAVEAAAIAVQPPLVQAAMLLKGPGALKEL